MVCIRRASDRRWSCYLLTTGIGSQFSRTGAVQVNKFAQFRQAASHHLLTGSLEIGRRMLLQAAQGQARYENDYGRRQDPHELRANHHYWLC
jgi:hypothetical protein